MKQEQIQQDFDTWWDQEGSGIIPLKEHDWEEHSKRISEIAWKNGAYKLEQYLYELNLD
jgi:hypothetical protein